MLSCIESCRLEIRDSHEQSQLWRDSSLRNLTLTRKATVLPGPRQTRAVDALKLVSSKAVLHPAVMNSGNIDLIGVAHYSGASR